MTENLRRNFQALLFLCVASISGLGMAGCATPYDYTKFRSHRPTSILVLPPLNHSTDIRGTYSYLSSVSFPLAERGYYVFPVAVVDEMMKENGLPTPGEMHEISLKKIAEIINPDAVLYITLEEYGSKYAVLSSSTTVSVSAKLVDTKTGIEIWHGRAYATSTSGDGGGGLIGSLVSAAVSQAVNSSTDQARHLCPQASAYLIHADGHGLLYGPFHKKYLSD